MWLLSRVCDARKAGAVMRRSSLGDLHPLTTPLRLLSTRHSLEATPAEVAPVDWAHYRKVIKTPGIVDAVQQKVRSAEELEGRRLFALILAWPYPAPLHGSLTSNSTRPSSSSTLRTSSRPVSRRRASRLCVSAVSRKIALQGQVSPLPGPSPLISTPPLIAGRPC